MYNLVIDLCPSVCYLFLPGASKRSWMMDNMHVNYVYSFCADAAGYGKDNLILNYQEFVYNISGSNIAIGLKYHGYCRNFYFTKYSDPSDQIGDIFKCDEVESEPPVCVIYNNEDRNNGAAYYFKVIARDDKGLICSDINSEQTYYQLQLNGMTKLMATILHPHPYYVFIEIKKIP